MALAHAGIKKVVSRSYPLEEVRDIGINEFGISFVAIKDDDERVRRRLKWVEDNSESLSVEAILESRKRRKMERQRLKESKTAKREIRTADEEIRKKNKEANANAIASSDNIGDENENDDDNAPGLEKEQRESKNT